MFKTKNLKPIFNKFFVHFIQIEKKMSDIKNNLEDVKIGDILVCNIYGYSGYCYYFYKVVDLTPKKNKNSKNSS